VWNSLPATLRQINSYGSLGNVSKNTLTFVYGLEIAAHCDFLVRLRYTNTLTYLLTPVTVT